MLEDMALAVTLPAGRSGQLNVQSQHKIQLCNSHQAGVHRQASYFGEIRVVPGKHVYQFLSGSQSGTEELSD